MDLMSVWERVRRKYNRQGTVGLVRSAPAYLHRSIRRRLPQKLRRRLYGQELRNQSELHEFWQNLTEDELPDGWNSYLNQTGRSKFLQNLICHRVSDEARILELGCNAGRNLHFLHSNGYQNLSGIEINKQAIDFLKTEFPELAADADLYVDEIEGIITEFETESIDLCFTIAVLEHIHPDSEFVFEEMARVSAEYIVTLEDEGKVSPKHVPRNYGEIFTAFGFEEIETVHRNDMPDYVELPSDFVARVFHREDT